MYREKVDTFDQPWDPLVCLYGLALWNGHGYEDAERCGANFLGNISGLLPFLQHPGLLGPVSGYVPVVPAFPTSREVVGTCLVPPCSQKNKSVTFLTF